MLSRKLVLLIIVQFSFKGCYCLNSTQKPIEVSATLGTILPIEKASQIEETTAFSKQTTEIPAATVQNPSFNEKITLNSTSVNQTNIEIVKIFHGELNITNTTPTIQISANNTITNNLNISLVNSSFSEQTLNDTFKTNYTTLAEAVGSSDNVMPFRLPNSAAIAAGVCLVTAIIGYISCVSYRRFLQRKYGNSQILIGEDVYDTTDLRNFEI